MKFTGKIIRNLEYPACKNCIHYRPSCLRNDFTSTFNKCDNFGVKDVVTDKITYDFADLCRSDQYRCGKEGKHFERQPRLWLKKLKHTIFRPITIFCSIPIVYLVAYYITFLL